MLPINGLLDGSSRETYRSYGYQRIRSIFRNVIVLRRSSITAVEAQPHRLISRLGEKIDFRGDASK
jgi:hypothetical protein